MNNEKIEKGNLENGFNFCIRNLSYFEKFVTMVLVVRVGSVAESENQRGIAHFLEHISMSFYTFNLVPEIKFRTKAYTDFNETIYYIKCPSDIETVKLCLEIYLNIVKGKYLEEQYFEYAKKDVLDEIESQITQRKNSMIDLLLQNSKYLDLLAIGDAEIVRTISLQDLKKFHEKNYSADNMALIIVGDIQEYEEVKVCIDNLYSAVKSNYQRNEKRKFLIPKYDQIYYMEKFQGNSFSDMEVSIYFKTEKNNRTSEVRQEIIEKIVTEILSNNIKKVNKEKTLETVEFSHIDLDTFYVFYVVKIKIKNGKYNDINEIISESDDFVSYLLHNVNKKQILDLKKQLYHIKRDENDYYKEMGLYNLLLECIEDYILDKTVFTYEEKCALYETIARQIKLEDIFDFIDFLKNSERFYYIKVHGK